MPELPVVAIRSRKNGSDRWVINREDLLETDVIWDDTSSSEKIELPAVSDPEVVNTESNDFVTDDEGDEWAIIIDPDNQRARKRIPVSEYNPDEHRLWSEHPRFQRR